MPNVNEVAGAKLAGRLSTANKQIEELQIRLSNQRSQVDVDKAKLQAQVSVQKKQLTSLLLAEDSKREFTRQIVEAVTAFEELPRVNFIKPKKNTKEIPSVLHLTDWHIGEVVDPKETEGRSRFTWEIAQDRVLNQLVPRFKKWIDTQRAGYLSENLHIVMTGDFVSGDIHQELLVTNEFPLPVQTANAGHLLGKVVHELAPHFNQIELIQIGADNHSRLVRKPQAKQKTSNSMSYLVYEICNATIAKLTNIKINRAEGMKLLFDINGTKFLGEHGDSVKSWMGVPFYGMEREKAREAMRRMFDGLGFHNLIMGHWHVPHFSKIIVGGCLPGTSEYDHSCGRDAKPQQSSFLVGKRGPFNFVPWELE